MKRVLGPLVITFLLVVSYAHAETLTGVTAAQQRIYWQMPGGHCPSNWVPGPELPPVAPGCR